MKCQLLDISILKDLPHINSVDIKLKGRGTRKACEKRGQEVYSGQKREKLHKIAGHFAIKKEKRGGSQQKYSGNWD